MEAILETKKRLLSEHPWSFALKSQRLNRLSQTPDILTGYQYAFQLPTDLIRIWSVQGHGNYILEGNLLLSNQTELLCTYIYNVDEVNLPPHVVKSLEYMLASEFAVPVTEDTAKAIYYEKKATDATNKAMGIDSQNRPQISIIDSPLIDARNGGGFGSVGGLR